MPRIFQNVSPFGDVVALGRTIKAGDTITAPDDATADGLANQPLNWLEVGPGDATPPAVIATPAADPASTPEVASEDTPAASPDVAASTDSADPAPADDASTVDSKPKK